MLGKFHLDSSEEIHINDMIFLQQMMERDDISVVTEGLICGLEQEKWDLKHISSCVGNIYLSPQSYKFLEREGFTISQFTTTKESCRVALTNFIFRKFDLLTRHSQLQECSSIVIFIVVCKSIFVEKSLVVQISVP